MERKFSVADFAALVGTTSKTIYQKIGNNGNLPLEEQLRTVREKVKGREVTLIATNSDQIEYYKNLYGNSPVNEGEYYETLTDNNGSKPYINVNEPVKMSNDTISASELYDRLITLNNEYNNRLEQKNTEIMTVRDELATVKQTQLLLEDKASREGFYINENNKLQAEINRYKQFNKVLITVIICFLLTFTALTTYNIALKKVTYSSQPVIPDVIQSVQGP